MVGFESSFCGFRDDTINRPSCIHSYVAPVFLICTLFVVRSILTRARVDSCSNAVVSVDGCPYSNYSYTERVANICALQLSSEFLRAFHYTRHAASKINLNINAYWADMKGPLHTD